jgi:hypothetical protein
MEVITMKKFTVESNYKEMVETAKELKINYVGIKKEALAEKINEALAAKETKTTKVTKVDTTGLVEAGKRGVTNFQMIPAIIANLGNTENLTKLYNEYPEVFVSSAKYINKKNRPAVEAVITTTTAA